MIASHYFGKIDVRDFKQFVAKNYSAETPLYKVLISERDEISREDFAAKFEVWLKLVGISLPSQHR